MDSKIAQWLFFRVVRWLAWIGFFAFCFYFWLDPRPHLNSFGHLLPETEAIMFGTSLVATFAGFLELMAREKTGQPRPAFGRNWLG